MSPDLQSLPSLGGVLKRSGFAAACFVQGLRLILIRIARGLDRTRGIGHQLADDGNQPLTLSRVLVGVQDDGGFPQGAQVAHDLGIGALAQLAVLRNRLFEFKVGHTAMAQGWATEGEGASDNAQNRKGFHGELPSYDPDRCGRILGRSTVKLAWRSQLIAGSLWV